MAIGTLLLCVSLFAAPHASAADAWIVCDDPIASEWVWEASSAGEVVVGTPVHAQGAERRILVVAGKRSTSYDVALGRIALDFSHAGLAVEWRCVNFAGDDARAAALLRPIAEDQSAFDLVVALGTEALEAVKTHLDGARTPVVTATCKNPSRLGISPEDGSPAGRNIAYTSLNVPAPLQLRYLRRLLPELSYLLVCVNRERKLVLKAEIEPLVMACREVGIAVELVEIAGPEGVADQLRASAPRALAKIKAGESAAWWVSSSTALHDHVAVLQELADLPVLSENPALVCGATHGKASAMAAIGLDRRNNAHVAAGYAIRILRQEAAAGDFPLGVYDPPDIAINVERFRHHGLRVPFDLLEAATLVYDAEGHFVALPGAESR